MNSNDLIAQHDELMTKGILYCDGIIEANKQIDALVKQREVICKSLNAALRAYEDMIQSQVDVGEVVSLMKPDNVDNSEQKAVEIWLRNQNSNLPLIIPKVRLAMEIPEEVKRLVEAIYNATDCSSNPMRYWSEKDRQFIPIPVSEIEKESIKRRCQIYAKSIDHVEMFETLRPIVKLINFSNKNLHASFFEGKLNSGARWIKVYMNLNHRTNVYEIDESHFFLPRFPYTAFDENNSSFLIPKAENLTPLNVSVA